MPITNLAHFTFKTNNNSILKYMFYIEMYVFYIEIGRRKKTPNTNLMLILMLPLLSKLIVSILLACYCYIKV